ncbi:hypothetical protein BO71DRAFT_132559 [Aspergillus ellipticus CBS 707.79]|uniref:Peptidase C14 caspase domain-containing protein n=1 Tax=Aspergillus ellipticus CBS 707.79 TaxID=1448320 RepID=A0A319EBU7_9EURO|nr:hypothetical protein BO71DRAFT_132559 [Aspergillus ellipticus CBS 707.79]
MASKWAVLIGVDPLSRAADSDTLNGCVADVERMRGFLQQTMMFPGENMYALVSSASDPSGLPTYANILRVFELVTERAKAGDVVYVHFSGSSKEGISNFGVSEGRRKVEDWFAVLDNDNKAKTRFLHDLELAVLLNRLTRKGLDVTVVLDTRSIGGYGESRHRFRESSGFTEDELLSVFHGYWCPAKQGTLLRNPNSAPYVLLWSMYWNGYGDNKDHRSEYQDPDSKHYYGFLTYWIIRLLEKYGLHMTWNEVVRQIGLETHRTQTVKVDGIRIRVESHGNTERLFLQGCDEREKLTPIVNLRGQLAKVDIGYNLIIDGGSAHGVAQGMHFRFVSADDEHEFSQIVSADLLFVVDDVGQLSSSASPINPWQVDADVAREEINGTATLLDNKVNGLYPRSVDDQVKLYQSRLSMEGDSKELSDQIQVYPVGGFRYDNGSKESNIRSPTMDADGYVHLLTGDYATIFLSSTCEEPIYIHILYFDSAFGVTQLSPKGYHQNHNTIDFRTLSYHMSFDVRLMLPQAQLLDTQASELAGYIKVIVTNKPTSFHSLELSAMRDRDLISDYQNTAEIPTRAMAQDEAGFLKAFSQQQRVQFQEKKDPVDEKWCCFDLKLIIHSTPESLDAV